MKCTTCCKCSTQEELESRRKDLYSNGVFLFFFFIKVRFPIQQILQQVPSVKFKLCLTKQGRHQPERNIVG